VATWRHFNLHREFDFSDEKMIDSIGLLAAALRQVGPLGAKLQNATFGKFHLKEADFRFWKMHRSKKSMFFSKNWLASLCSSPEFS